MPDPRLCSVTRTWSTEGLAIERNSNARSCSLLSVQRSADFVLPSSILSATKKKINIITKNKKKYNSVKKVDQKYERFLVKKKKIKKYDDFLKIVQQNVSTKIIIKNNLLHRHALHGCQQLLFHLAEGIRSSQIKGSAQRSFKEPIVHAILKLGNVHV